MKLTTILLAGLVLMLTIVSCKKDSPSNYPIAGLYLGTYTVDNLGSQGALFYSIIAYPDGSIITKGKGGDGTDLYASGTYSLTGTTFSATVNSFIKSGNGVAVTQIITATYSSSNGTLTNGTWADTVNPYGAKNAGKFSTFQRVK